MFTSVLLLTLKCISFFFILFQCWSCYCAAPKCLLQFLPYKCNGNFCFVMYKMVCYFSLPCFPLFFLHIFSKNIQIHLKSQWFPIELLAQRSKIHYCKFAVLSHKKNSQCNLFDNNTDSAKIFASLLINLLINASFFTSSLLLYLLQFTAFYISAIRAHFIWTNTNFDD